MAEKKEKKDKKWIQKADIKEGAFTAKAKRKGITSAQLQANVEKNPDKYDAKTRKQAALRKTLVKVSKKKKEKDASKKED
tara:strand:+ start:312 stop:551 length:240 start_codon:yes stop_codon:yes gene_type:complete